MNFNRRSFLITLAGSGFVALSSEAMAFAPDRYKRLIDLAANMSLTNQRFNARLNEFAGEEPAIHVPTKDGRPSDRSQWTEKDYVLNTATIELHTVWTNKRRTARGIYEGEHHALVVQADHLLNWTMENFAGPANDETRQQIKALFDGRLKFDLMDEAQLRTLEDPLINCILLRTMIRDWRLPLDTQRMTAFTPFAERYRELIMA